MATTASDGAHPPAYDIAFILNANLRIRWPLEAKVLRNEKKITAYVAEIRDNFLTGRYAPFCLSAGMLGFLLAGRPEAAADRIAEKLDTALDPSPPYHPRRPHYRSSHRRDPIYHQAIAGTFTCHHLIMPMRLETGGLVPCFTPFCICRERPPWRSEQPAERHGGRSLQMQNGVKRRTSPC